jgi:hypothetical protein
MFVIFGKWMLLFILKTASGYHPYYISVTEIEHILKENEVGVSCKIFTDDFENTLKESYKTKIDLINPADKNETGKLMAGYISAHLRIKINNHSMSPEFIGFEREGEATWCYFSIKQIRQIEKLEVTNNLLYDFKKEQVNLMHIAVNNNRKSARLTYPDSVVVFEFR